MVDSDRRVSGRPPEPIDVTIRAPRAPFVTVAAATVVLVAVALGGVALVATHLTGDVGRLLVELQTDPRWHRVRSAHVIGLAAHGCLLPGLAPGAAGSDLHVRLDAAGLAFERRVHRWLRGACPAGRVSRSTGSKGSTSPSIQRAAAGRTP